MRNLPLLTLVPLLALAACGENTGWNPNYSAMHNGSRYADYLQKREVALHGRGPVPDAIPVQLPAKAPTAADIAGVPAKKPGTVTVTTRPVAVTPNPVAVPVAASTPALRRYALQESQNPGQTKYPRAGASANAAARACLAYPSVNAAQTAFIAAGGPVIDPRGLDPDGDGFVCGWDPRPYRQSGL